MVKKDPSLGVCGKNMFGLALSHLGWTERERNGRFNRMDGNGSPTAIKRPLSVN